jgi:hypothetical protein
MNQTSPFGPIGPPSNPTPNYFSTNPNPSAARYFETAEAGAGVLNFTTPLRVVKESENEEEEEKEAERDEQGGREKDAE